MAFFLGTYDGTAPTESCTKVSNGSKDVFPVQEEQILGPDDDFTSEEVEPQNPERLTTKGEFPA